MVICVRQFCVAGLCRPADHCPGSAERNGSPIPFADVSSRCRSSTDCSVLRWPTTRRGLSFLFNAAAGAVGSLLPFAVGVSGTAGGLARAAAADKINGAAGAWRLYSGWRALGNL